MTEHTHGPIVAAGTAGVGGVWWLLDQLVRHGPEWSMVPPLIFATASLLATINLCLNDWHKRRLQK